MVSKAVVKNDEVPAQHKLTLNEQILLHNSYVLRKYFGVDIYDSCGSFWDSHMAGIIESSADWVEYPAGNRLITGRNTDDILCMAITSDGRYLFTGSADQTIIRWDLSLKITLIRQWKAHADRIRCLTWHASGKLASGSTDQTIRIWDGLNHRCIRTLIGQRGQVTCVAFNRDSEYLVSGSTDKKLYLWLVSNGQRLRIFEGHTGHVISVVFVDDYNLIVSGSKDKSIRKWEVDNGRSHVKITDGISGSILNISLQSVNNDEKCERNTTTIFPITSMIENEIVLAAISQGTTMIVSFTPMLRPLRYFDARDQCFGCLHPTIPYIVATAARKSVISIMNVVDGSQIASLKGHSKMIHQMAFTPDGQRLITVSDSTAFRMWDVSDIADRIDHKAELLWREYLTLSRDERNPATKMDSD